MSVDVQSGRRYKWWLPCFALAAVFVVLALARSSWSASLLYDEAPKRIKTAQHTLQSHTAFISDYQTGLPNLLSDRWPQLGPMTLYIPFVNNVTTLVESVKSVKQFGSSIAVIDNSPNHLLTTLDVSRQELTEGLYPYVGHIITPVVPLTFSQTMNMMMDLSRENSHKLYWILHNDAVIWDGYAEAVAEYLSSVISSDDAATREDWCICFTYYDIFMALNPVCMEKIGPWDTVLHQYFADNDYYHRIHLAGFQTLQMPHPWSGRETTWNSSTHGVIHYGSNTLKSDPKVDFLNSKTFPLYELYHKAKWGKDGSEYKVPFNSAEYGALE